MVLNTTCEPIDGLKFLKGAPTAVPAKGHVTVIELWAKWCGPCRQVFPHLSQVYKARKDRGLVVVGISIEDDPSLPQFVESQGENMSYTVAVDGPQGGASRLMQRAGVNGIPHAFVVNRQGKIVHSGHPAQPDFEAKVDEALNEKVPEQRKPLPHIVESREQLQARSIKELKAILAERNLSIMGLSEKSDLVDLIDKQCRTTTYYAVASG